MIKQIYLVRGDDNETYDAFKDRVGKAVESLADNKSVRFLSYNITVEAPPKVSIIPFKKKKITSITVKKEDELPVENLLNLKGFNGAYNVTEAHPVAYEKTWADGEKTPGACLLTLFKQKKSIDYKTFLDRWHNSHTPLSLKIHPLWHYNRNVVEEKLSNDSAQWDGIVEEHMRTRSELLNPFKFFGNPIVIIPRMIQVYTDTKSFLDYKSIEPYLVTEYHVK
jgi:hypothetical protein